MRRVITFRDWPLVWRAMKALKMAAAIWLTLLGMGVGLEFIPFRVMQGALHSGAHHLGRTNHIKEIFRRDVNVFA